MEFLATLLIILAFVGAAFFLINIRHIFTGQEFRGTCASNSPFLKEKLGGECSVCGKGPDEACKGDEQKRAAASGV
ncbi:MAG: hypothetical protein EA362_06065 [Saprospirales bacterium]|nr:MAG: hypothetical protein EA362_06065 [Saprospirales bacterium]